ncbi:putative tim complex component tim54 protein [Venturia nashicola]|nr:putative tim complex component tim54 protein [Venturia nashicola]
MADSKDVSTIPKEPKKGASTSNGPSVAPEAPKKAPKPPNPVFKMMGLPNFSPKLPSRNWMIFWTIAGTWSGAIYYDRVETKKIRRKWCDAVKHLADEPLPSMVQQRKMTIYLSSPPADGLLTAREHFHEYVKPVLLSAGLDWDAVEGRREGDVRAGTAERIRKFRKMRGERSREPIDEEDLDVLTSGIREKMGVREWDGPAGDIVIGRNTWKEYIRGLHEGWLGPIDTPKVVEEVDQAIKDEPEHKQPVEKSHVIESIPNSVGEQAMHGLASKESTPLVLHEAGGSSSSDDASPTAETSLTVEAEKTEEEKAEEERKKKVRKQPPPFISTKDYSSASVAPSLPIELAPSTTIPLPHILGFLNTPIRMYRFLSRRYAADDIGRQVASACFAAYRPYQHSEAGSSASSPFASDSASPSADFASDDGATATPKKEVWEQEALLENEEAEWHKSIRKNRDLQKESVWLDPMVLDARIAGRMRRFQLDPAEDERVKNMKDDNSDAERLSAS